MLIKPDYNKIAIYSLITEGMYTIKLCYYLEEFINSILWHITFY